MKSNGFTLIETLIASMITVLVGFILLQVMVQNNGLYISQIAKVNQGLSLNDATNLVESDIKSASSVAVGYPSTSPTLMSSSTTLILQVPSLDASGSAMTSASDYFIITPDSSNPKLLKRFIYPDPSSSRTNQTRVLLTNLSKIEFDYLGSANQTVAPSSAVKVNFVINSSDQVGLSTQLSSSSGQVILRNE